MLPKYHLLFGFVFSIILWLIIPSIGLLEFSIIFLSSFLIDVDHYIYYVFTRKDLSLKNAYRYFIKKRKKGISKKIKKGNPNPAMFFLHGVEVLTILFISGVFISKYFFFVALGFAFHLILDVIEQKYYGFRIAKLSLIYDFIKFRKDK